MDQSLLLALPDDALLAVLAYLPPRQLFSCRVLCRRVRDLCLHADLWRRVRLQGRGCPGLVRAVLRLAPCLRALDLSYCVHTKLEAVGEVLSRTSCVVTKLELQLMDAQDLALAPAVLQKQFSLGGLSELALVFSGVTPVMFTNIQPLFAAVNRVTHLEIANHSFLALPTSSRDLEGSPSLKKLSFTSSYEDSLLEALLQAHAATLEHVCLLTNHVPVSSLKALPELRSLIVKLNTVDDVSELKALPKLDTLKITNGPLSIVHPGVLELLREASQLRSVSFSLPDPYPLLPLFALAASCSARVVDTLRIATLTGSTTWRFIVAFLPKFPSLQTLTLASHCDEVEAFLRVLTPEIAPRLSVLLLESQGSCPHAWLHDFATNFFQRNPHLHLRFSDTYCYRVGCKWCILGCHRDLKHLRREEVAFAAHSKKPDCPRRCYRWPC